jgi:glycosyltransferase involved in cell wall biosynthesis
VLWLGRFDEARGFADVLEAWRPLRADPRLALLLVGRPAGLRPVTPDAGDNVHVVPWLADPNDALLAADVFVLPSHGEGMANALLEALASGLPVISTPVGAGASLVGASGAGLIVPVGDVAALRAALVELTDAGADRATMAAAARAAVADLTIDRVVDRVEAVYRELLRTDRGPVAPDAEHGTMGSDTTSVRTRASRE